MDQERVLKGMDRERTIKSMTNISPTKEQILRIEKLRESYKQVVYMISDLCPDSEELNEASKQLQDSLMWAVKSIILEDFNEK